jgi:hypothetical protein
MTMPHAQDMRGNETATWTGAVECDSLEGALRPLSLLRRDIGP